MAQSSVLYRRVAASTIDLPPGATPDGSRGQILNEALRLFAEQGYGGASIRDIANRVGMKNASLYFHYPSKAHVLAELIRIGHDEHFQRMRDALRGAAPDIQSQLTAIVRAHVCAHAEYPMLAVVSNAEIHALPDEFAAPILDVRRQSETLLSDVIQRGVNVGVFKVPDVQLAVAAIGAMGLRVAHWYTPENGQTPDQIADVYALFASRMLGIVM